MTDSRDQGRPAGAMLVCLLLLVATASGSTRRLRRVAPIHKDYEYPNLSQSTLHEKSDRCPPPPQMLPEQACEVQGCRADSECETHKRCCYNGCIYTCLESVQPPPVLDWLVQPKPRWLGGNGWLLDGPDEVLQGESSSPPPMNVQHSTAPCLQSPPSARLRSVCVPLTAEACSTTEDGDEPLRCPTGYECHVINPGNPPAGIPNRGQCIKQPQSSGQPAEQSSPPLRHHLHPYTIIFKPTSLSLALRHLPLAPSSPPLREHRTDVGGGGVGDS